MKMYRGKVGKRMRILSREDLRAVKHLKEISKEQSKAKQGVGGGSAANGCLPPRVKFE